MKNRINFLILFAIILIGLLVRLYKLNIPLADHHSWRQADTAAVARNFVKDRFNFLQPKIDNRVPLHPGVPNDSRLFLVEPPIYNSIVAGAYQLFGINDQYARIVSIIFSLGSIIFLYLLVANLINQRVGLLSAFFFAVLPYNIFYSRVILPEPMIIFFTLGMIYFAISWINSKRWFSFILFCLFSALSFSQKAFPLFYSIPLAYLFLNHFKLKIFTEKKLYIWLIISIVPLLLWRWWIGHYPEGIPGNEWLFNQGEIRFKGAFFYWIFARRIGELILGWWGLPLFVLGLLTKPKKEGWFFHFWLLAILIFTMVFAAGNVTHDYYQIPLIPILCIFLAKGSDLLLFSRPENFSRIICHFSFVICLFFTLAFGWYQVRDFYNIQGGVDLAGRAIDRLTPKDTLVITGDSNDATLLYNTNRWGWSAGFASAYPNTSGTIEELTRQGAGYYVTTKLDRNSDFGKYMLSMHQLINETNQYVIFRLIK